MPKIIQLDSHVSNLIAAGEVVERPASVVKELMENAIDAGAKNITVEIVSGGMSMIRVTDDGCGIEPEDVETAFLRHATSKLRRAEDLEAIGTLGFRGEALAATAAVSRIEIMTRTVDHDFGVSLTIEGGTVLEKEECGGPVGTTMIVRNLFFNTPARMKFMKKDSAEGAAVFANVQNVALSHPEISFRFIREGRQELLTPGDGQMKSAMYSVMGRDMALGLMPVTGTNEDMSVTGFVSIPTCCRGSRSAQHFFVNGRYIKSRTMMAALEEAYRNQKMVGKFPACVLHLTVKIGSVDVNVHPAKTEVKFGSEKRVFDTVYYAVKSALEGDNSRPKADLSTKPKPQDDVTPNQFTFRNMTVEEYKKEATKKPVTNASGFMAAALEKRVQEQLRKKAEQQKDTVTIVPEKPVAMPVKEPEIVIESVVETETVVDVKKTEEQKTSRVETEHKPVIEKTAAAPIELETTAEAKEKELPEYRIAGELFHTYVMVEVGDKVLLIDKHAAHERMNFDRLKAQGYRPMVQQLITPQVIAPGVEEASVLLQNLELLEEFGFQCDDFGDHTLAVRQVPYDVPFEEVENTLCELAGKLMGHGRTDPNSVRDDLLHTIACKAAIKGGQVNGAQELETVVRAVLAEEVKYCPHGRPVAIELTRKHLEKQFGRIQ